MRDYFPRFCPGCAQRKLQMNAAPCEICGRVNKITPPKTRDNTHFSAKILRALLAPLGRLFHALTAIFCAFALWSMALHGVLPFLGFVSLGLILTWLMVAGIWLLRLTTRAAVWVFAPITRQTKRPGALTFLVLPACLAVLTVLNHFDAPLRAAFWLSQPGLEQVVNTAIRGARPMPLRAGAYRVAKVESDRQNIRRNFRLEVTDSNFLWSGTKAGFAKCDNGCQNAKFPSAWMRSEASKYIQLSRDWFWWEESGTDD